MRKSEEKIVNFCVDHSTASMENGETCPNCLMVPACLGPLSSSVVTALPAQIFSEVHVVRTRVLIYTDFCQAELRDERLC